MKLPPLVRRLAEQWSRGVLLTRRLPGRFGALRLRVSPEASLTYYRGLRQSAFADLYDFAEHHVRTGQTVWDVGANLGVFSFAAAARAGTAGRVLCLEPDPWSARLLLDSRELNRGRGAPVEVLSAAVSDTLGLARLNIPERGRAASHLDITEGGSGAEMTGGVRDQILVPTVTLDWLMAHYPRPDVLKIDVDGNEARVLAGGNELLHRHRPVILTEVYERNATGVSALLHSLGYTLYNFDHGEKARTRIDRAAYNTLALPPVR